MPGDSTYAGNFLVFGGTANITTAEQRANYETVWDGKANLTSTFSDGTSNTVLFAEKYSRCDGGGSPGGTWWMGRLPGLDAIAEHGHQDSYPGDRLSAVFAVAAAATACSGTGDGVQVPGPAPEPRHGRQRRPVHRRLASTPHQVMQVAMGDGSVRPCRPAWPCHLASA
jgi:hypothetical protein